ncbi:MAG: hypothetical protein KGJ07_02795 [Patescibacteria group bacterium]|nr:hypothetical protein [Patescibacteria group bacterium]MDE2591039.1 hypothetical protein [Patescibacteria group bacterium]
MGKFLPRFTVSSQKIKNIFVTLIILFGTLEPFIFPAPAAAVAATGFVRTDRMVISTATGGTVCMTPETTGTVAKVLVTFPGTGTQGASSYGVNTTAANWTVTTTNLPTGATAWPGIGTATAASGATVTFPSTGLTLGTQYCFNFTGTSTLSTTTSAGTNLTGTIVTETSGNSAIDTINYATATVDGTTKFDSVSVTATVPSTFTFYLSAGTAALGTLATTGAPTAQSVTVNASTNAQNGYIAWVKNTNNTSSLVSSSTGDGICVGGNYPTCTGATYVNNSASNLHNLSGNPGYGVNASSGTATVATSYSGSSPDYGSLDNTKYEQLASDASPVSGSTITVNIAAEASATNKAATDYADTIYITGAGQF